MSPLPESFQGLEPHPRKAENKYRLVIILDKPPSKKAKLFCCILVAAFSVICILIGLIELYIYSSLKDSCTAEVTGTVIYEGTGSIKDTDSPEYKYVSGKYWRQIEVETDGTFNLKNVYASRGAEKKGDKVTIHYDPSDPDNYYISDGANDYKTTAIIVFAADGFLILLTIFIMVKSGRHYKALAEKQSRHIYFDTPYCRFFFVDSGNIGFEGEVQWEADPTGESTCTVFFETDTQAVIPKEGYYGLIEKHFLGREEELDLDINMLAWEIPQLRSLQPGKCYSRLEKILSDKSSRDYEIRKLVADHFLFRPELIRENSTEQELMDSIEISYIGVSRNGDTEFGIFGSEIYVDELRVILKADGSKEIHYRTDEQRGTNDECCDVL